MTSPELPPELWAAILEFLSSTQLARARQVCHRWNQLITRTPSLLARFRLRLEAKSASSKNRALLESGTRYSRALLIGRGTFVQDATWWPAIGAHLSELVLKDCRITVETLLNLLGGTPRLRVLKIESRNDFVRVREVPEVDFQLAALEHLHVAWTYPVEMFNVFRRLCPGVKELKLIVFHNDTRVRTSDVIEFVGGMRNSLQKVSINAPDGSILNKLLNLQGLRLTRLEIEGSFDQLPIEINEKHPTLNELHAKFVEISDQNLSTLGQISPNLSKIAVRVNESGPSPVTFLAQMSNLTHLHVICVRNDESDEKLAFAHSNHPNLDRLTMSCSRQTLRWIEHFPNLATLELDGCKFDSWTNFLSAISKLKNLKILKLELVLTRSSVEQIQDISQMKSTKIEVLQISVCNIPYSLLKVFLKACPKLTKVGLEGVNQLDDEAVLEMGRNSSELRSLRFSFCGCITNSAVDYVIENCERLVEISIESCKNVSQAVVQKFRENNMYQVTFREA